MDGDEAHQRREGGVTPTGGLRETPVADRRALVTGAAGGIGLPLVERLLAAGYGRVRAVDVRPAPDAIRSRPGLEVLRADLRDAAQARAVVKGCTDVFHLASVEGARSWREGRRAESLGNDTLHHNVLMGASRAGATRVTFASSVGVAELESETSTILGRVRPSLDVEAETKRYGERLCEELREERGLEVRIARLHSVLVAPDPFLPERARVGGALAWRLLKAARRGAHLLELRSSGDVTRSFMSAEDAAEGLHRLHESGCTSPLEIGGPTLGLDDLLDQMEQVLGARLVRRRRRELTLGPRIRGCEMHRIERELGWSPSEDLEPALARLLDEVDMLLDIEEEAETLATEGHFGI